MAGKTSTKSEEAYRRLKRGIETGQFAVGEQLTVRGLAEELGLGIMPVREALVRAESEGLLTGGGAYARRFVSDGTNQYYDENDLEQVVHRLELRCGILSTAAMLAAMNMNQWQLAHLRRLADAYKGRGTRDKPPQSDQATFISYLVAECGNPLLLRVWEDWGLGFMVPKTEELNRRLKQAYQEEHGPDADISAAVDAVEAHDPERAGRVVREYHDRYTLALRMLINISERTANPPGNAD
jgi:DNA-binding GntR family transcriptional regulator